MANIEKQLIRLGYRKPELRQHIRPVLDRLAYKDGDYGDQSKNESFYPSDSTNTKEDAQIDRFLGKKASQQIRSNLKSELIRLGEEYPQLQEEIRPVIDRIAYKDGDYGDQSKNRSFYPDDTDLFSTERQAVKSPRSRRFFANRERSTEILEEVGMKIKQRLERALGVRLGTGWGSRGEFAVLYKGERNVPLVQVHEHDGYYQLSVSPFGGDGGDFYEPEKVLDAHGGENFLDKAMRSIDEVVKRVSSGNAGMSGLASTNPNRQAAGWGRGKSKGYPRNDDGSLYDPSESEDADTARKLLRKERWPKKVEKWLEAISDGDLPMRRHWKEEIHKKGHPLTINGYYRALKEIDPTQYEYSTNKYKDLGI